MMDTVLMWVWWSITVAICAWKVLEGFWRPYRMLEWPFLACAMWAYFYGYMAYNAVTELPQYLGNGMANLGQFIPLLCLIGLLAGWHLGTRGQVRVVPENPNFPYFNFWLVGMLFLAIGTAGGFSVLRAMNSGTYDPHDDSGYWFLFFYVGYPGQAITVWALCKSKIPGTWRACLWIVTILGIAAFMYPHLINARRGPLFPAILILLLVPALAKRRTPNPLIFFGSLAMAGVLMLVFLQVRDTIYNGGSWGVALKRLDFNTALTEKVEQADDNEYINNCQLITTVYLDGKYQYGTGHLSLLIHWVPRSIWKDKPTLGEGIYSFDEMWDDVEATTGFRLLGNGAAPGGVANTFVQYGFLCPLFWFGLSWLFGFAYLRARNGNSARWLFCYVGFICASHWLVSQDVPAAFVPGMFFQIVPICIFLVLDRPRKQTVTGAGKRRVSSRQPVLAPTASS